MKKLSRKKKIGLIEVFESNYVNLAIIDFTMKTEKA